MELLCIIVPVFNVLQAFTPYQASAFPIRERRLLEKRRTTLTGDEEDVEDQEDGQPEKEVVAQQPQQEQQVLFPNYQVGM